MEKTTVARMIARMCAGNGVKHAFGVPGGGSSLDLIEAFRAEGIAFHLCRTETGAVLMAAADAELRNGFGVAVVTQGPGAASAMNGLAHGALDRAPVLFISDGWTPRQVTFDTHQVFDQRAMSGPVVKASGRLESDDPAAELESLVRAMFAAPWGPAHIELTGENAGREVGARDFSRIAQEPAPGGAHGDAAGLLRGAKRPVLIVGLEARVHGVPEKLLALAERLRCPVFPTYKAKGVLSDESPWVIGHFTGGAAERDCIAEADLIVLCGLDPVELIGRPWPYTAPVIDIALQRHPVHYVEPAAGCYGALSPSIDLLLDACPNSDWAEDDLAGHKHRMRERLAYPDGGKGVSPQLVVECAMEAAGKERPAITIDAGAHMFSAMAFWQARLPRTALISNGLATMGYALPAGIASALNAEDSRTIVFTGDGGLLMCAGELVTAAQACRRLCIIVFNDSSLSLIALKQANRGLESAGVGWRPVDFAGMARALGLRAWAATTRDEYVRALSEAFQEDLPCLIDVRVDPAGYGRQASALRG